MTGEVRAVIDVGTNSVKLLVGEVAGNAVRPLREGSRQTRLGRGFYHAHELQPAAIAETARAVADFASEARALKPARIRVIATSAARDAVNKDLLIRAIETAAALPLEIISGEQEADWAYRGVTSDPDLARQTLVVMDVGGGSTEFICGRAGQRLFADSFRIGSVRLLERYPIEDPPGTGRLEQCESEVGAVLRREVKPRIDAHLREMGGGALLVATGGASTILARIELRANTFDRAALEGLHLSRESVRQEKIRLWSLPLAERKKIAGLPPNRADVILPGVVIFDQAMDILGFPTLRVSTRGIRFAALTA